MSAAAFQTHVTRICPNIEGKRVLVACSGGPDSLALLYLFAETSLRLGVFVGTASVDHGLRDDAREEQIFVKQRAEHLGVPFHKLSIDPGYWRNSRSNMEERARKMRYNLLYETAEKYEYDMIATGHHQDDQAETVLMRVLERGTGVRGLSGIRAVSTKGPITVIRPLLPFSRKDLRRYLGDRTAVIDPSNSDTTIRRNHFRNVVMPFLDQTVGSEHREHLAALADTAKNHMAFSDALAKQFWNDFAVPHNSAGVPAIYFLPRTILQRYSRRFWETALSHLFSEHRGFSHCRTALSDAAAFISKHEQASCRYSPFLFSRNSEGITITREERTRNS